jgi:hypothetical protein
MLRCGWSELVGVAEPGQSVRDAVEHRAGRLAL